MTPGTTKTVLEAGDILNSVTDAVVTFDREWRFAYLNDQAERVLARERAALLGRSLWDEFPETVGTVSDIEYHRAVAEQVTVSFEQYYPPLSRLVPGTRVSRARRTVRLLPGHHRAGRAQRERERFLADLAERARGLADPDEVIADAVRSVGEFLGVARCVFADIDIEADTCTIPPDYCADDTVASMAGTFPISDFGPFLVAEYGAGRTVVVEDVRADAARFPAAYVAARTRPPASAPLSPCPCCTRPPGFRHRRPQRRPQALEARGGGTAARRSSSERG